MKEITGDSKTFDALIGTVVQDRYRVISRLGEGGMGVVYEVEHVLIGRRFALKALNLEYTHNAEAVERFHREARAAAAVGDEHIVEVNDMGHLPNGSPYIVLELLEGHDLGVELKCAGVLSISRAVEITKQCCVALQSAHRRGIIHRDIKPDNIFLTQRRDGSTFIKILDFGISKFHEAAMDITNGISVTKSGFAIGTPQFMSPEQVSASKEVDARTDVYAIGAVLFKMLVGRTPFDDPTYPKLAIKIMYDPPPSLVDVRPDVPKELQTIIHRALAKEPNDRYCSIADLGDALTPFAGLTDEPRLIGTVLFENSTPKSWEKQNSDSNKDIKRYRIQKKLLWLAVPAVAATLGGLALVVPRIAQKNGETISTPTPLRPHQTAAALPRSPTRELVFTRVTENGLSKGQAASHVVIPATRDEQKKQVKDGATGNKPTTRKKPKSPLKEEPTSQAGQIDEPDLSAPATRTVVLNNRRRASVRVTLKCGGAVTEVTIPANHKTSTSIATQDCRVTCTGVGQPYCSIYLRASAPSLEIE